MFAFKSLTCNFNDNSVGFLFKQSLKCIVRTSEYIASVPLSRTISFLEDLL